MNPTSTPTLPFSPKTQKRMVKTRPYAFQFVPYVFPDGGAAYEQILWRRFCRGPADGHVIRAHPPTMQAVGNSTIILKHLFHE